MCWWQREASRFSLLHLSNQSTHSHVRSWCKNASEWSNACMRQYSEGCLECLGERMISRRMWYYHFVGGSWVLMLYVLCQKCAKLHAGTGIGGNMEVMDGSVKCLKMLLFFKMSGIFAIWHWNLIFGFAKNCGHSWKCHMLGIQRQKLTWHKHIFWSWDSKKYKMIDMKQERNGLTAWE